MQPVQPYNSGQMTLPLIRNHSAPSGLLLLDRPASRGFLKSTLDSIESMTPADIDAVVAIHEQEIPGGVFTELGRDLLTRFYRQVVISEHARGFVIKKNRRVVGYIAGCTDASAFFKQLYAHFFLKTDLILLMQIIARPSFLPRFMQRVLMNRNKSKCAESLAGAVLKEYQARGYGIVLLRKLFDDLRKSGAKRIQCVVVDDAGDPETLRLHGMYKKGGYVPVGRFRVGRLKYIRYSRGL